MSNKFEDIRKKMEELSSKKESVPFTIKKVPVAKSVTPSSVTSPTKQASITKTLEDKGQAEAQLSNKQHASDGGMWQDGEGIVTRRIKEAAAKDRALQSEKDAEMANQLQKAEEARVKFHLQGRPSEAAGTAATLQLMQELDAKEKAARLETEREDAEMARRLQQEEALGVRLHFQEKPLKSDSRASLTLMQELDAKEKAARIKAEREDAEMAQRLQQEEEARVRLHLQDQPSEAADAEFARQLSQFEDAKPGSVSPAQAKPKK